MQDNKQICESIDHQEFSSVIETGPRHRKLVQAYQKAMEMIMQKCRQVFIYIDKFRFIDHYLVWKKLEQLFLQF